MTSCIPNIPWLLIIVKILILKKINRNGNKLYRIPKTALYLSFSTYNNIKYSRKTEPIKNRSTNKLVLVLKS